MNNRCRARGVAGSAIDFLICAAAHRRGWSILTTDHDFENYASVLPLRLHSPSANGSPRSLLTRVGADAFNRPTPRITAVTSI